MIVDEHRGPGIGLRVAALVLAIVLSSVGRAWADDAPPVPVSRPEDLAIKLITFGPGDPIYSYFGHNALIVEDQATREAHLYNFGMFSFGMSMLPRYLMGRLVFWVADTPVEETIAHYVGARRSVHIQELNLAPTQRGALATSLAVSALPRNREYLYDHYRDNCSTRLRDLIDRVLGGQFRRALDYPARLTYRGHTRRYAQHNPLLDFALLFWMNDSMERPLRAWDELFLPGELERQVGRMHYVDERGQSVPLVTATQIVFEPERAAVPEWPARSWPWTLLLGCASGAALLLTALWMRRVRSRAARVLLGAQQAVFGLAFGTLGTLGFLMWMLTEHTVTYRNENQLLANPLTLLALPLGVAIIAGSSGALWLSRQLFAVLTVMSLALCCLKLLPAFDQDTLIPMTILVPINLAGMWAYQLLARSVARVDHGRMRDPAREFGSAGDARDVRPAGE
jgi:hypothetical protein